MPASPRRTVLRGAGLVFLGSLAGCAGRFGNSPRLGELGATNYDTRPHTIHVLLLEADSPVYWTSKRVPAAGLDGLGTATFAGYPDGAEPDRLLVRPDGRSLAAAERFEFGEYDADCLGLDVEIDDGHPPSLSIWYTAGDAPCRTTGAPEWGALDRAASRAERLRSAFDPRRPGEHIRANHRVNG